MLFRSVLPLVVTVIGVGRMAGLRLGKHQPLAAQDDKETITTGYILPAKHADEHQPELVATDTGILRTDFTDGFEDSALMFSLLLYVSLRLVEGLTAMAK